MVMDHIADLPASPPPERPRRRGRARIVPQFDDWPAPDRAAWLRACTPASLLDDEGQVAAWRPASREAVSWGYSRWLAFLTRAGVLADLPEPAERITPERVQAFVADLRESGLGSVTLAIVLSHLVMAASALWPGRDWAWLRAVRAALQHQAVPSRRKEGRLVSPAALFDLGQQLMAEAEAMPERLRITAARQFRDGLLVGFLSLTMLRRKNLTSIELGRHLRKEANVQGLVFAATEMKAHAMDDRLFPPALAPALERYLTTYRPVFAARRKGTPSTSLWLGPKGEPLLAHAIWKLVTRHTRTRLGISVNPHLFRDAGVTFLGDVDPEHVRMAAPLLGHASFTTTERHYILAKNRNALRLHQETIMARRAALRRRRQDVDVGER